MADTGVKFVSRKVNKIRWRPKSHQHIQQSDVFVTGSWDDHVSVQDGTANAISVWTIDKQQENNETVHDVAGAGALENEPTLLCEAPHRGDVTDLLYINQDNVLAASSTGSITLYRHHTSTQTLNAHQTWEGVHHHPARPCPCTCIAVRNEDIVSAGEDGRIHLQNIEQRRPTRILDKADGCTINAVKFLKQSEIITVNSNGQLKIWDLRKADDEPTKVFSLTGEQVPLNCVDSHPHQSHIVATGGQDGMLCMWDMRQDRFPITLLDAHSADMWEVKFHPSCPNNLFTCSEDGSVWHWDGTSVGHLQHAGVAGSSGAAMSSLAVSAPADGESADTSPWLATDATKHRIEITDIIPGNTMSINTLDIEHNTLVCGSDAEAIYVVTQLVIR